MRLHVGSMDSSGNLVSSSGEPGIVASIEFLIQYHTRNERGNKIKCDTEL